MTSSEQERAHLSVDSNKSATKKFRRRTPRACDRCRLKKAKCDGRNRCSTCNSSDSVCVYSTRKDGYTRNYYSHMRGLTDEALQLLYAACREGKVLPGLNSLGEPNGHATTNEILQSLGLIGPNNARASHSDDEDGQESHLSYGSCSPRTPSTCPPASTMPSTPVSDADRHETAINGRSEHSRKSFDDDLHLLSKGSKHARSRLSQSLFLDSVAESVELSADFTRVMYDGHELVWPLLNPNN